VPGKALPLIDLAIGLCWNSTAPSVSCRGVSGRAWGGAVGRALTTRRLAPWPNDHPRRVPGQEIQAMGMESFSDTDSVGTLKQCLSPSA